MDRTISLLRFARNSHCDCGINHNSDMTTIGEKIQALRKSEPSKLSQKDLAKAAGVSQTTIADLERGRNDSSTKLTNIALALGFTAEELELLSIDELIQLRQASLTQALDISPDKLLIRNSSLSQPHMLQAIGRISRSGQMVALPPGTGKTASLIHILMQRMKDGAESHDIPSPELISLTDHPDLLEVPRVKFKLSAGVSGFAIDVEQGNGKPIFFRQDWFEANGYRPEKLFAVRIYGQSMEPRLWEGDLVVINTADTTPKDGEPFALNYEGELVIKRLRRDAGEWWACSDNPDQQRYAPKRCTEDVKIIGMVVYRQGERI